MKLKLGTLLGNPRRVHALEMYHKFIQLGES